MGCEIYIPNSKDLFIELAKNKEDIEKELGIRLVWMELEGKKAARIKYARDGDINDSSKWNEYFEWLKENWGYIISFDLGVCKNKNSPMPLHPTLSLWERVG